MVLTQGGLAFFSQLGVLRLPYVLVAQYLLQRAYDEHLFGVGPLDHVNRGQRWGRPPSASSVRAEREPNVGRLIPSRTRTQRRCVCVYGRTFSRRSTKRLFNNTPRRPWPLYYNDDNIASHSTLHDDDDDGGNLTSPSSSNWMLEQ